MIMKDIFGIIFMILAIGTSLIGLPNQIYKNRKEKKCGTSFWMAIFPFSVFVSRFCYAIAIDSWYLYIPDGLGIIFAGYILYQYFLYKKTIPPPTER